MADWVKRTLRKYGYLGILDYCIDCEQFVVCASEHKTGTYKDHMVVRLTPQWQEKKENGVTSQSIC